MSVRRLPEPVAPPASLKSLRDAVKQLQTRGMQDVRVVRQSFVSGQPPLQTFSSGSKADFIDRFSQGVGSEIIRSTAQFGLHSAVVSAPVPPPRAELDFIEVGVDRSFGVLDSFFSRVVFSIELSQLDKVAYFRVLRASNGRIDAPVPSFSAIADSQPFSARTKSSEGISNSAFRASEIGIGNSLTEFIKDDRFARQRVVVSSSSLRPLPFIPNNNRRSTSSAKLLSVPNGDRSVVENITFFANQRMVTRDTVLGDPLGVGRRQGINVLQGSSVGSSTSIVSTGNSMGFSEVARIPSSRGKRVGSYVEFEYWDPSVVYGASYSYYVVSVSLVGFPAVRSRIVQANVTRSIPPSTPEVLFAVLGNSPRFQISCSGSFTDHVEVFRKGGVTPSSVQLLSTPKAMIDRGPSVQTDSGFYHVGDVGVGSGRSCTFIDRNTAPGQSLDYRIYSVDSFGLKSSTPFSCSIFLPDVGRVAPLGIPSVTAEQAPGDRIVRISLSCDDPRVSSFILTRRELTTREALYRQPSDPAYFTLGDTTPLRARSRSGPSLNQFSSRTWSGVFPVVNGSSAFLDSSVQFDRVYQYSVRGVDSRGSTTADVQATPVFVAVKPVSDAPVGITGTLLSDSNGNPRTVVISWNAGTLDFSPNDLIGNQDVLAASSQRSVYQVERRSLGSPIWNPMPVTTGTYFFDHVIQGNAPNFRPAYVSLNKVYDYRVIAMQSGAFISPHTDHVRLAISPELSPPPIVFVRSSDTSARPVFIVVSWQYDGPFVDCWEVERAVTNKVFGSRIPSMDSSIARGLQYFQVAKITRESSRGLSVTSDGRPLDPRLFGGNRAFIDRDISMSNSYFYRVRALDVIGRPSADWTYGGILLTDSPFDRKFFSSLSDAERSELTNDPRPASGWSNR